MKFPQTLPFAGDKKLAIELLKLAKENLQRGRNYYLCTAVIGAATVTGAAAELDNCSDLVDWIQQMLGEDLAYVTQTPEFLDALKEAERKEYVLYEKMYRLAWADNLISYLETQA